MRNWRSTIRREDISVLLHLLTTGVSSLLIALASVVHADDPDTFSPVVSFQYQKSLADSETTLTSPVVSFQYQESLADSETTITSPVVSFQFYEWPGDENLTFENSPAVSYQYYDTTPQIVIQPKSQLLRVGAIATLSVTAVGPPPLSYHWRFNGQPIDNATDVSLTRLGLKDGVAGKYSVVVSNEHGSTTSADAQLIVYDSPATVKPTLPSLVNVIGQLSPAQTAIPRLPGSTQLKVMAGTTIDPNKMTIVMTHGWTSSSTEWPADMAIALAPYLNKANILAWDWQYSASQPLTTAAARTVSEGTALGNALMDSLGTGYQQPIHFMGHSLGTMVNCCAANYIHGDRRPRGDLRSGAEKYNATKTHMTLFDEAELVTGLRGLHVFGDVLLGAFSETAARDGALQLQNFWSQVIPENWTWIDNYISQVGLPHIEAVNVMLWRKNYVNVALSPHGYAYEWYRSTIVNPLGSDMGHRWSFERNTLLSAPIAPAYYLQSLDLNGSEMEVKRSNLATVQSLSWTRVIAYPTAKAAQGLAALSSTVSAVASNTIRFAGSIAASIAETFSTPTGTPVYLNTAGSTAAYFLPTGQTAASDLQANWDLGFSIKQGIAQPQQIQKGIKIMALNSTPNGPVYTIIPVHVPNEAVGVSFEYSIAGSSVDEFMTMGIDTSNEYTMEAKFLDDGAWNGTPVISVSDLRGKDVELVFALNGVNSSPAGVLSVRNIQFYIPPRPELTLEKSDNSLKATWPLSAQDWTIETTTDLTDPNGWQAVNQPPNDTDFFHTHTFDVSGTDRAFFRLRK